VVESKPAQFAASRAVLRDGVAPLRGLKSCRSHAGVAASKFRAGVSRGEAGDESREPSPRRSHPSKPDAEVGHIGCIDATAINESVSCLVVLSLSLNPRDSVPRGGS
jgi:hypothetical protein